MNPLNGEGIDYGLETGRSVVELFDERRLVAGVAGHAAPALRRGVLHRPPAGRPAHRCRRFLPAAGPVGMRSRALMTVALRVMGNLVTDEDRDVVARAWRLAGTSSAEAATSAPRFACSGAPEGRAERRGREATVPSATEGLEPDRGDGQRLRPRCGPEDRCHRNGELYIAK